MLLICVVDLLTTFSFFRQIPSTDEIRRAACRVQGRTYSQAVKARDERLKSQVVAGN